METIYLVYFADHMSQATNFYVATLWLLVSQPISTFWNPTQMVQLLKKISEACQAEIVQNGSSFEVYGLESSVRRALSMLMEVDVVQVMR